MMHHDEGSYASSKTWKCPGILFSPGKILEFFEKKKICPGKSWKNKFACIFFILHNYMIGDSMMRQQNFF